MTDEQVCGATVEHPEFGMISCTLEPHGDDASHKWPIPDSDESIEWDNDVERSATAGADFDIEAFVKALPDGVALCPVCLGIGAVVEDPPFDPHTYRCPTCLGHGRVRTGSVAGSADQEHECSDCGGKGYRNRDGAPPATPARSSDLAPDVKPVDAEGRTPDHPDFDWTRVVRNIEPEPVVETV